MRKEMVRALAVASIVVSVSFMAGGCAKKAGPAAADKGMGPDVGESIGREESLAAKGMVDKGGNFLEGRTSAPMMPVYFDFDKSDIRADQKDRIKKNGEFLISNAKMTIRVEGNCDERGTNEYNMALGERRAISAKKFLANMGVAEARMETISFGEEKPLNFGHDELSWSQNRRADFVIN